MNDGQNRNECEWGAVEYVDGICYGTFHNVKLTLEGAKEIVSVRIDASKSTQSVLIADVTNLASVTKDARNYFSSEEGSRLLNASAIVVGSEFTSTMANFFIKVNFKKPLIPIKMFSKIEDAEKWIKEYR